MFTALLKGLLKFISSIANIILAPLNVLIIQNFPSLGDALNTIGNFINNYFIGTIRYVVSWIPPGCATTLAWALSITVTLRYFGILYDGVVRGLDIIKRLNIFSGK